MSSRRPRCARNFNAIATHIHSTAFRRLVYKTQVFVNYEGDLYRTRLTHSLEVAQIARTAARALRLNEDLVEAISLAHDLGHTPFGHAGQDALNECMRERGGFEHNLQSLRVVDHLEDRYASFRGLNLTFETREGILKHCSLKHAVKLGDVGRRFLDRTQAGLEAQLANIADEIAYNNHDVDDGLRSGLVTLEQLATLPFLEEPLQRIKRTHPKLKPQLQGSELVRDMIGRLVADLVAASAAAIAAAAPRSVDDVRALPHGLIESSAPLREERLLLKRFLRDTLYMHPRVQQMTAQARDTVRFFESLRLRPHARRARDERQGARDRRRRSPSRPRRRGLHRRHDGPLRAADARFAARRPLAAARIRSWPP